MILCVTGTGTDVGKTVATAALASVAAEAGWRVRVVKPVQTGEPEGCGDLAEVQRLSGVEDLHEFARYPEPVAPVMAASIAGMSTLNCADVAKRVRGLDGEGALVLVEGAGGLLVELGLDPQGRPWGLTDLASAVEAPVVLVTSTGLGALNHASLTLEALHNRGLTCAGVIGGSMPPEPDLATRLNVEEFISGFGPVRSPWLGAVPAGAGAMDEQQFTASAAQWIRLP